jgi:hypothetical protein
MNTIFLLFSTFIIHFVNGREKEHKPENEVGNYCKRVGWYIKIPQLSLPILHSEQIINAENILKTKYLHILYWFISSKSNIQ